MMFEGWSEPIYFGLLFGNALVGRAGSAFSDFTASVPGLVDQTEEIVFIILCFAPVIFESASSAVSVALSELGLTGCDNWSSFPVLSIGINYLVGVYWLIGMDRSVVRAWVMIIASSVIVIDVGACLPVACHQLEYIFIDFILKQIQI